MMMMGKKEKRKLMVEISLYFLFIFVFTSWTKAAEIGWENKGNKQAEKAKRDKWKSPCSTSTTTNMYYCQMHIGW